jgi:outer membrane protein assembly factor BamB
VIGLKFRQWRGAAIAALAVAILAGCSGMAKLNPLTWWGQDRAGPQPAPLTEIKSTFAFVPAWRATIGQAGNFLFVPAIADGMVYAASAEGFLAAFGVDDGVQKWRVQANRAGLSAGVGAGERTVVVATAKGEILAFDASGAEKWKASVSSEVLAPPLVVDGAALIRSNDNRIHAFALSDGKRRWTYQRTAPALVLRNFSGLVAGDGTIYAGFPGGKLVALALGNGSVRWEATVAAPRGATEL